MASFKDSIKNAGMNSATEKFSRILKIEDLVTDPQIMRVFNIDEALLNEISDDMRQNDYDKACPIVVWLHDDKWIIVDGHTRYRAALLAGLKEVPVCQKEFESAEDALLYTYRCQLLRRNLTNAELLQATTLLQSKKGRYGKQGLSAEELAKHLGTSVSQIKKAKKVLKEATPEDKAALLVNSPGVTIHSVWNKLKNTDSVNDDPENAEYADYNSTDSGVGESCESPINPEQNRIDDVQPVSKETENTQPVMIKPSNTEEKPIPKPVAVNDELGKMGRFRICIQMRHLICALKNIEDKSGIVYKSVQTALALALHIYTEGKPAGSFDPTSIISQAREFSKGANVSDLLHTEDKAA